MTRLIGLTGRAGAGKDEAAKALVAAGWTRDAFADRMRTAVLALDPWADLGDRVFGIPPRRLSELVGTYGWDHAKREFPEVRRLLQRFGTEAGREIHGEDCWVDALFSAYDHAPPAGGLVITDVRFDNEARAVRDRGGLVVRIVRPDVEALPGGHASEAGVADALVDHVLRNERSIEHLGDLVVRIARGEGDRG